MSVLISLLRAVNVSGQKPIHMDQLKALYSRLGFGSVATYIQSGNVVFESQDADPTTLAEKIHQGIQAAFGFSVAVLVYPLDEWRTMIGDNPFSKAGSRDTKSLHVTFLSEAPTAEAIANLSGLEAGDDEYHIQGRWVYLCCPNGYGRTKLNNLFWEKKLRVSATTRNWNTVGRLLELAEAIQSSQP
jgi:uncharacterized protein (DUF1697 family)